MAYSSRINKLRDDPNFDLTNLIDEDGNTLINHCSYFDISEIFLTKIIILKYYI